MGRPLFSQSYQTPAVRVEPEQPHYERWTYWNAFDPDSDEFFDDVNAVYEAVVGESQRGDVGSEGALRPPTVMEVYSSSSSEGTSSGRGSPTEEEADLSVEEIDLALRRGAAMDLDEMVVGTRRRPGNASTESRGREVPLAYREVAERTRSFEAGEMLSPYANMYNIVSNSSTTQAVRERVLPSPSISATPSRTIRRPDYTETGSSPASRLLRSYVDSTTTSPRVESSATQLSTPLRPTTPVNQNTPIHDSPSPAPAVTPRLYSWPPRSPIASYPASPAPAGPLTNRNARLSVAHIPSSQALVPVHRVIG